MSAPLGLPELLADPRRVAEVERADVPALLALLAGLQIALAARLVAPVESFNRDGEELVDVDTAAALVNVPRQYIWRRSRRRDWQSFVVRVSRKVMRIRRAGLLAWAARQGTAR